MRKANLNEPALQRDTNKATIKRGNNTRPILKIQKSRTKRFTMLRNKYSFWRKHIPELWKTLQLSFFMGLSLMTLFRVYSIDFITEDSEDID
jgi:hypothetical protein